MVLQGWRQHLAYSASEVAGLEQRKRSRELDKAGRTSKTAKGPKASATFWIVLEVAGQPSEGLCEMLGPSGIHAEAENRSAAKSPAVTVGGFRFAAFQPKFVSF